MCFYWSNTEENNQNATVLTYVESTNTVYAVNSVRKNCGLHIRCIKKE